MNVIKCPTGWLIAPSDDGNSSVPFFVNVREQEIHWNNNNDIYNTIKKYTSEDIDLIDCEPIKPGIAYRYEKDNWRCEIQTDGLATMTKTISIDNSFNFIDETKIGIESKIDLPFLLQEDFYFNIQTTLNTSSDSDLCVAIVNTKTTPIMNVLNDEYGFNSLYLNILSPIYHINNNFIDTYKDDKIFIMVRGMVSQI